MKMLSHSIVLSVAVLLAPPANSSLLLAQQANAALVASSVLPEAPVPNTTADGEPAGDNSDISGTVTDVYGDLVPDVNILLDGPTAVDHREVKANDNAGFEFSGLKANVPYRLSIKVKGFADWTSSSLVLTPGQHLILTDIRLKIAEDRSSVTVYASTEQIATEQVQLAETQRVLGFIPNFYVVYDSKNAVPLTAKLKFKLALRVSIDPITVAGVGFMSGVYQAANRPDYQQGAAGYGQRFGSLAADSFSDILIAGAILPTLLHQDPRYFYQGAGSTRSRLKHALLNPFLCRGDNGRTQINYSSLGGDIASSAIANAYYPESNRGASYVLGSFAIGTGFRMMSGIAQEFVLPRLTPSAKKQLAKEANAVRD